MVAYVYIFVVHKLILESFDIQPTWKSEHQSNNFGKNHTAKSPTNDFICCPAFAFWNHLKYDTEAREIVQELKHLYHISPVQILTFRHIYSLGYVRSHSLISKPEVSMSTPKKNSHKINNTVQHFPFQEYLQYERLQYMHIYFFIIKCLSNITEGHRPSIQKWLNNFLLTSKHKPGLLVYILWNVYCQIMTTPCSLSSYYVNLR